MNAVLIIVAVAAVMLVAALLIMRGRKGKPEAGREDRRGEVRAPSGAPPAVAPPGGEAREAVAAAPRAPAPPEKEAVAAEAAVVRPPEVEPPRPQVSESEIRDQVRTRLEAAERMLSELREAAAGKSVEELTQSSGSVEIMAEGLQEVRALVERKQWSQAKHKGEALHAQLSLLLQSARREAAS